MSSIKDCLIISSIIYDLYSDGEAFISMREHCPVSSIIISYPNS